jgi:monofunctional biosynthetic peptidoglycan transglycosylase
LSSYLSSLLFRSLISWFMPDISSLKGKTPHKTAYMKYREKEWAKKGRGYKITQTVVPLSKISPYLLKAVLIAEDDKFCEFWGHNTDYS